MWKFGESHVILKVISYHRRHKANYDETRLEPLVLSVGVRLELCMVKKSTANLVQPVSCRRRHPTVRPRTGSEVLLRNISLEVTAPRASRTSSVPRLPLNAIVTLTSCISSFPALQETSNSCFTCPRLAVPGCATHQLCHTMFRRLQFPSLAL